MVQVYVTTTIRMPEELYEQVRQAALEQHKSGNWVMITAIREAVTRREPASDQQA